MLDVSMTCRLGCQIDRWIYRGEFSSEEISKIHVYNQTDGEQAPQGNSLMLQVFEHLSQDTLRCDTSTALRITVFTACKVSYPAAAAAKSLSRVQLCATP